MPAFGFSAVPLPTNIRRTAPGCHPPTAAADATGPTGSAVVTAAGTPSSCRDADGATTGASPSEPDCNHDNNLGPGALTPGTDVTVFAEDGSTDVTSGLRCRVAATEPGACACEPVGEPALGAVETALGADPRAARRDDTVALVDADAEPEEESAPLDPVDPAEPVVSADANGTDAIAEPTPSATAKAPTRPTYRA